MLLRLENMSATLKNAPLEESEHAKKRSGSLAPTQVSAVCTVFEAQHIQPSNPSIAVSHTSVGLGFTSHPVGLGARSRSCARKVSASAAASLLVEATMPRRSCEGSTPPGDLNGRP